jgi:O-antigen/teichoic acid export membrane protein
MPSDNSPLNTLLGTGGFAVFGQLVSFLGVIGYARLSTTTVLGEYFLLVSVVSIAAFIGTAGISTNVTRVVSRTSEHGASVGAGLALLAGAAIIFVAAVGIGAPVLRSFLGHPVGPVAVALVPAMAGQFGGAILRGEERPVAAEASEAGRKALMYVTGAGLVLTGTGPYLAFVSGFVGGWVAQTLALATISDATVALPGLSTVKSFLAESKYLYFARLSGVGFEWTDTLLLGALGGPAAVAAYEIVWRLSGIANLATNAVVSVYYPRFTALVTEDTLDMLRNRARQSYYYAAAPVLPLLGGGILVGRDLISVAYGPVYGYAATALAILFVGRLAYAFGRVSTTLLYANDDDREVARIEAVALTANVALNIMLIPPYGVEGAAVATTVAYLLGSLAKVSLTRRKYRVPLPVPRLGLAVLATVLMASVVRLAVPVVGTNTVGVATLVLLGGAIFVGSVVALDSETRKALRGLRA